MTFSELGLMPGLLEAVQELGFETPTEVQRQCIPVLLEESSDLIALARTGTGKTAAFGLPLLQKLDLNDRSVQALVLAPTRELCLQIGRDLNRYGVHLKGLNIVEVYGGAPVVKQLREIEQGAQLIVATPGRCIDLMDRRALDFSTLHTVVLDEADEMLNMGFWEDVQKILSATPEERSIWLFSATMPSEIERMAGKLMKEPIRINTKKTEDLGKIDHRAVKVDGRHRYQALRRLLDYYPEIYGIVFCRTRIECQQIAEHLNRDGYAAQPLHGDLSQQQRDQVMNGFRSKITRVLVATDVAARGIDVNELTHVIHYQLPDDLEAYTHRSGRTARAGKEGISIALVARTEEGRMKRVQKMLRVELKEQRIPTAAEVCERQLLHFVDRVRTADSDRFELVDAHMEQALERLEGMEVSELLRRVLHLEFQILLNHYQNQSGGDLNPRESDRKTADFAEGERGRSEEIKLRIDVGSRDGFDWQSLKDALRDAAKLDRNDIGNVQVSATSATFMLKSERLEGFLKKMESLELDGRTLRIEPDTGGYRSGPVRPQRPNDFKQGGRPPYRKERGPSGGRPDRGYPPKGKKPGPRS
ncbi:DEAD/DEAH box helicase [bacterium]|nr:DEAD/DEAH box helicase [bacterium]